MTQAINIQNLKNGGNYKTKVEIYEDENIVEVHTLNPGEELELYVWNTRTIKITEDGEINE